MFCTFLENPNDQLGKYLLVMEYADGGTLRNHLKKHSGDLTWKDKYNLAYQLVCVVTFLHDKGIVHQDLVRSIISCENLMGSLLKIGIQCY